MSCLKFSKLLMLLCMLAVQAASAQVAPTSIEVSKYNGLHLAAYNGDTMAASKFIDKVVTIAAVANDLPMLDVVLELGANSGNITSPYDGTALIAAAHLGHHQVVKRLIDAKAPLDHINNLHWTALIESVVLGDGGPDHIETARLLLTAGADKTIGDRSGITPLQHAVSRGYEEMINLFERND